MGRTRAPNIDDFSRSPVIRRWPRPGAATPLA